MSACHVVWPGTIGAFVCRGAMIFNPPDHLHDITVGDRELALLAYAWIGAKEDLHALKMVSTRTRK